MRAPTFRKILSGRAMRAPMFASDVPGAQCVRPRSQVVLPSVASYGRRAREERAVASRGGWGLPRGGCSGRARARPRIVSFEGRWWAETPFGEASFVRVPAVPRLRTLVCAARGGRVPRGIAPATWAMLWHVEWCERNGRRISAIRARTIARHSLSRREWRRRGLVGTVDDV